MPKGGGSKTPQLDHFPLNTDMVEKQGGKKVRLKNLITTCLSTAFNPRLKSCLSLKPHSQPLHLISNYKTLGKVTDSKG